MGSIVGVAVDDKTGDKWGYAAMQFITRENGALTETGTKKNRAVMSRAVRRS